VHCHLTGDLTAHLLQQLEHWGFPAAARFHYVYVDEVQDLTVAQLALLKHLCCDAASGYLFAGDTAQVCICLWVESVSEVACMHTILRLGAISLPQTHLHMTTMPHISCGVPVAAQTIARGVGFRFQDLRSLFFTDFLSQTGGWLRRSNPLLARQQLTPGLPRPVTAILAWWTVTVRGSCDCTSTSESCHVHPFAGEASAMAPIFQLDYNYRTHEGIVSLASTIVRALTHLFPEAIDRLKPERSHLRGEMRACSLHECLPGKSKRMYAAILAHGYSPVAASTITSGGGMQN
jgi:hypothetical protein